MRLDDFTPRGATSVAWIAKDPDAVLDYTIDWTAWLADSGADTIASSSWTVPAGLTQNNATRSAAKTTIWLSGGTLGATYRITNRIVTSGGRTAERSFDLVVQQN
jgi:hypothetical protein